MKKIKLHAYLFLAIMISALYSCEQNKEVIEPKQTVSIDTLMPAFTDTGANTLAYRVNGVVVRSGNWINYTTGITAFRIQSTKLEDGYILYLEGQSVTNGKFQSIVLELSNVIDTGLYVAKEPTNQYYNQIKYRVGKDPDINSTYVTTDLHKGYIHIKKLDTLHKIVAGTFYFTGKLFLWGEEKDTLQISEGQFDVKFQ